MTKSPIDQLLGAIDMLDVEAAIALMAPDCQMLAVDGRRAEGVAAVRELLADFLAAILHTTHRISAQWHQDDFWIAEVDATYELKDRVRIRRPRAFVLRDGPDGLVELHVYGAHEAPLADRRTAEEGMRLGGQWIPPL
ncbi:MAG: nuclear transport factor 2 family protein [Solirubrobacteraceae bacterium]